MNKVRTWDKQRDTKLITLRLPATHREIDEFLSKVAGFGETYDGLIHYGEESEWLYAEFEMGTRLSGGRDA